MGFQVGSEPRDAQGWCPGLGAHAGNTATRTISNHRQRKYPAPERRENSLVGRSCLEPLSSPNLAGRCRLDTPNLLFCVADDFHDTRLTERRNPRSAAIDTASSLEIVDLIGGEDAGVPCSSGRKPEWEIARVIDLVESSIQGRCGRLIYVGAVTSGRLGVLDAAECPPTFGTPPEMVVGLIAGGPARAGALDRGSRRRHVAAAQRELRRHLG